MPLNITLTRKTARFYGYDVIISGCFQ